MPYQSIKYWSGSSWDTLDSIASPLKMRCHSVEVVNGHLCTAGGHSAKSRGSWASSAPGNALHMFHWYNKEQRKWLRLDSMRSHRANFSLVHMNKFVYAIGDGSIVERYSLEQKLWQSIAPLSTAMYNTSAVVYQGKILVYGKTSPSWSSEKTDKYILQVFTPDETASRGTWSIALDNQQHKYKVSRSIFDYTPRHVGILTVQNDKVYRITCEDGSTDDNKQLCVTELECDFDHHPLRIHLGATEDQSVLRSNIAKTGSSRKAGQNIFSIGSELYAKVLGCVYKMGITNSEEDVRRNIGMIGEINLGDNEGAVALFPLPGECRNSFMR